MFIPREIKSRTVYINRIKPFMYKSIVKVLTGHRRVGKSYLLFQLIKMIKSEKTDANIIYINKEDIAFIDIRTSVDLHKYIMSKSIVHQKNHIFIDEIQDISDFHVAVRSLALDVNNDIYITGSNSEIFSVDLANSLGGRYVEFRINSLSFTEFLDFHNLENTDEALEKYMHYGGLPYLIHLPMVENVVMEYLRSIYSTIILRDVIQRKNIRNSVFLEQLVQFIANHTGSLFSAKSISDFLKSQRTDISPYQVGEYLSALVDAFVLHCAKRYDLIGKRTFERVEKYYFENLGIRNVIASYKPQDRAQRLENIVYNHLIYCGYEVKIGKMNDAEIDFVCRRDGEMLYVQVASELSRPETIEREFGNLLKIQDQYPKLVVTGEKSFEKSYLGVQHIYIRDFLSKYI